MWRGEGEYLAACSRAGVCVLALAVSLAWGHLRHFGGGEWAGASLIWGEDCEERKECGKRDAGCGGPRCRRMLSVAPVCARPACWPGWEQRVVHRYIRADTLLETRPYMDRLLSMCLVFSAWCLEKT